MAKTSSHYGQFKRETNRIGDSHFAAAELNRLRLHLQRERPYGDAAWTAQAVKRMGLEWTMRDRGRPQGRRKPKAEP